MRRHTCLKGLVLVGLLAAAVVSVAVAADPDPVLFSYIEDGDNEAVAVATDNQGYLYVLATCENDDGDNDAVVVRFDANDEPQRTWVYYTTDTSGFGQDD